MSLEYVLMSTKRMAVIGDLHLKKIKVIPNQLELQVNCLHFIMRRVVDEGIKDVVLLGDVFDAPLVDLGIVMAFLQWIESYPDQTFWWLTGNHDRDSGLEDRSYADFIRFLSTSKNGSGLSNLKVITNPVKEGRVSFLPYPHNQLLPGTALGIAHCDRPGAKHDNGSPVHSDIEWDEKAHFIIGHIHSKQKIKRTIYPGSPWQNSFGEKPDKEWAIIHFNDDPKKPLKLKYNPIPVNLPYTLVNLKIESKSDLKQVKEAPFYYKLTLAPGVILPKNWLLKHPNCQITGRVIQRIQAQADDLVIDSNHLKIGITYKLDDYLSEKGLSKKQSKIAMGLVNEALKKLSLAAHEELDKAA